MLRAFLPEDMTKALADMAPFSAMEIAKLGTEPRTLIDMIVNTSAEVKTIAAGDTVLVVGGVRGQHLLANEGALWAVFTNAARRHPLVTMRGLREASTNSRYTRLWSIVDEACYGWVEKLGFSVGQPQGAFRDIWR